MDIFINKLGLNDQAKDLLKTMLVPKKVYKKQLVLHAGEIARHIFFVTKGCLRSYTIDDNGGEHIFQFAIEGWAISDMYSFLTGEPGTYTIDAVEDTDMYLLSKEGRDKLHDTITGMDRIGREVMERNYIANQRRINSMLSDSLQQRYTHFIQTYPEIAQRVPQHMLASYLGMSPETLSRVRKQLSLNKEHFNK